MRNGETQEEESVKNINGSVSAHGMAGSAQDGLIEEGRLKYIRLMVIRHITVLNAVVGIKICINFKIYLQI